VIDAEHDDGVFFVVDLVDHPVRAAARRVEPGKLALKAPTDTVWVLDQCGQHEGDDRSRCALG
jgi:hypothetical protein